MVKRKTSSVKKKLMVEVKEAKPQISLKKKITYAIIAIIVLFVLTSGKPYEKVVPVTRTVTVTEPQAVVTEEPYTTIEYYQEKVPYGRKICQDELYNFTRFSFNRTFVTIETDGTSNLYTNCSIKVMNNENVSGDFALHALFFLSGGRSYASPDLTLSIPANDFAEFSFLHKMANLQDEATCQIINAKLPSLYKCKYLEPVAYSVVEKARTVNKTRNVSVVQNVTSKKQVTEYVNRTYSINRFFGYSQPFYFGY